MMKDFLSIHDLSLYEFHELLDLAQDIKESPRKFQKKLHNITLAFVSPKPSFTAKATFEVGMLQLGGRTVHLEPETIPPDAQPSPLELAKKLERWVDGIILADVPHEFLLEFARISRIPVINASTLYTHPCQALADFFTIKEHHKDPAHLKLAYLGPARAICHSLILAAAKAGSEMVVAAPPGNEPDPTIIKLAKSDGKDTSFQIRTTSEPEEAAVHADILYTDRWIGSLPRQNLMLYQVNAGLMARAQPDALFMYGHPGLRQNEATDEVYNSQQSIVFDQVENKLHIQKAIMVLLLQK